MHQGAVLLESYGNGGGPDRAQLLASATKGLTGVIGAIAAAEGLFDLDEPRPAAVDAMARARADAAAARWLVVVGLVALASVATLVATLLAAAR
jgi:hypothetical protein